jgi:hypothetical protein
VTNLYVDLPRVNPMERARWSAPPKLCQVCRVANRLPAVRQHLWVFGVNPTTISGHALTAVWSSQHSAGPAVGSFAVCRVLSSQNRQGQFLELARLGPRGVSTDSALANLPCLHRILTLDSPAPNTSATCPVETLFAFRFTVPKSSACSNYVANVCG